MNGDEAVLAKVDDIEADGVEQIIPAMTLQELYIGVGASNPPDHEPRKLEAVLRTRPVVPTSKAIARKAGLIDGRLRREGQRINVGDAAIGATGLVRDEPVPTGDPEHFERIPGLGVERY